MSGFEINYICLSGNLTRDPELRSTSGGTSVCSLRIANNTRVKRDGEWEDKPNYFNVTVWSGVGEWVAKNLSKGDSLVVSGRIEFREWQDKEGNTRQSYDVTAESVVPVPRETRGSKDSGDVPADTDDFVPATVSGGSDDDIPF